MAEEQTSPQRQVVIKTQYLKELRFSSPKVPEFFFDPVKIEKLMNIQSANSEVHPDHVEVTLTVGIKAVADDESVFRIDTVHAGVFMVTGYTPEERVEILGRVCPEMLFAFARLTIEGVTRRAGFMNVLLRPLDFHSLFAQNMRERAAQIPQA